MAHWVSDYVSYQYADYQLKCFCFRHTTSLICSADRAKECCVSMDDSWSTSWGGLLCAEGYQEESITRCGSVYDGFVGRMVEGPGRRV